MRRQVCYTCGETFRAEKKSRYCSHECYQNRYCAKPVVICPCGKPFKARASKKSETGRQKFCSWVCRMKYGRGVMGAVVCERCGKTFEVYPSRFKFGNPRYCSQSCAGNMRTQENERFRRVQTAEWEEIRKSILDRDGHKCAKCGSTEQLTVHHIIPWARSRDDTPANLISLCRSCHWSIEWNGVPCPMP